MISLSMPPELLENYTAEQLSNAVSALIIADIQAFAKVVRDIDATVKRLEADGDGFTPYPKLSAEFDAEVKAVLNAGAEMVKEGRVFIGLVRAMKERAANVRTRYEQYAKEVRATLENIEESPRG